MGMRYYGRWHFPIASKLFSQEVVVCERAAPSGGCSKLEVGLSLPTYTGEDRKVHT